MLVGVGGGRGRGRGGRGGASENQWLHLIKVCNH